MINTTRLRCMLGWLGLLLPWIVVLILWAFPPSISATWYGSISVYPARLGLLSYANRTVTPFMIILGSSAFLLISYKGYEPIDDITNTLAGIAALAICLFPCAIEYLPTDTPVGTFSIPMHISNIIHCASAIVFFGLLSFNSLFLFVRSSGNPTPQKLKRNIIYRMCGIGMVASFLLLPIGAVLPKPNIITWVVEAVALFFFGMSYLTKSNCYPWLFCDPHTN